MAGPVDPVGYLEEGSIHPKTEKLDVQRGRATCSKDSSRPPAFPLDFRTPADLNVPAGLKPSASAQQVASMTAMAAPNLIAVSGVPANTRTRSPHRESQSVSHAEASARLTPGAHQARLGLGRGGHIRLVTLAAHGNELDSVAGQAGRWRLDSDRLSAAAESEAAGAGRDPTGIS